MAKAETLQKGVGLLRPGFEDRIRDARYRVDEDRFLVTFDSGKEHGFARSLLDCDDGTDVVCVEVGSKRFFFRVTQASGNQYEVPWDRVLYEADAFYSRPPGHRSRTEKPQQVGRAIRRIREAKGMTQAQLARGAKMLRPNLSRIEAGTHRPALETLERIAQALNVPVVDLILKVPSGDKKAPPGSGLTQRRLRPRR